MVPMVFTVACPDCNSEFPVDPAKVPEDGVFARCTFCPGTFQVERPEPVAEAAPSLAAPVADVVAEGGADPVPESASASAAVAAEELALEQYRAGRTDLLTVLESERRSLNARSTLIEGRRLQLEARIDLFVALGGGFDANGSHGSGSDE